MQVGGTRLIFDAGTGLHVLGKSLLSQMPIEGHLFFTPAFISGNKFDIYGAFAPDGSTIEQRLNDQMLHPNFPVPLQIMQSNLTFHLYISID